MPALDTSRLRGQRAGGLALPGAMAFHLEVEPHAGIGLPVEKALKKRNRLAGEFPAAPGPSIHRADLGAGQRVERGVPGDGASERAIMEDGKPAVGQ